MHSNLNIAAQCAHTHVLGPGNRFGLWVQGCPFNCKNCISPNWIPFEKKQLVSVIEIAHKILQTPDLDGITLSGGEPFLQAGGLAELLATVLKVRPALNVIVFTGFEFEQLIWPEALELIALTDVVVDGKYIDSRNDSQGLRGSSNQNFHFITDVFSDQLEFFEQYPRNLEIFFEHDRSLQVGIPIPNIEI